MTRNWWNNKFRREAIKSWKHLENKLFVNEMWSHEKIKQWVTSEVKSKQRFMEQKKSHLWTKSNLNLCSIIRHFFSHLSPACALVYRSPQISYTFYSKCAMAIAETWRRRLRDSPLTTTRELFLQENKPILTMVRMLKKTDYSLQNA